MSRGLAPTIGATYRLQLVEGRGFAWAGSIVPYLARLGIETVYLSPVAEAVPGSAHGYDGTDPTTLRRSLGGLAGYVELFHACEAHGLGLLVDWVPNHLATWTGGPWWRRLLAEGRDSEMGRVFDIDWDHDRGGERGKVVLPLLDRPLPEALAAGTVTLGVRAGSPVLEVGPTDLPVSGGAVRDGEDLAELLAAQHYRLADWHDAADRNYRRFFDIDGLVGVRVEDAEVFERTHTLVGALAAAGLLSGVRIDHIDGLAEPAVYLRRLADLVGVPIVVEKILTGDEQVPDGWPVLGTTGYEALDDMAGALVDPEGLRRLVDAGRADGDQPVHPLTVETRSLVAGHSFPADLARAARRLEVPVTDLTATVIRLGRYRTYLSGSPPDEGGDGSPALPAPSDVEVWRAGAGDDPGRAAVADAVADPERRRGTVALQQLTGSIMAKGVEDTAWYRLSGPLAFCEVGGDPAADRDGGWERLVERAAGRVAHGYTGLIPGSTHDTKRSADVRCRLYALSERSQAFEEGLVRLRRRLDLPDDGGELAAESRMLAQLLLGILPPLSPGDPMVPFAPGDAGWAAGGGLTDRLCGAVRKSTREAKRRSSWVSPDVAYEARLEATARRALAGGASVVVDAFGGLVSEVARLGAVKSLAAVVLRHVLPGVPDCYQGDEAWHLSLVDPDNRRPVDYGDLAIALDSVGPALGGDARAWGDLRRSWRDGRLKLALTAACLAARPTLRAALAPEAPVGGCAILGPAARSVAALARGGGPAVAVGVVTRLAGAVGPESDDLPHGPSYAGSELVLPDPGPTSWRDTLTGRVIEADGGVLALDRVLAVLPVALLAPEPPPH